jgi:hypothetical protein
MSEGKQNNHTNKPINGYFYIAPILPNHYATASLSEIVDQLAACSYRCEAGPLELNLAFIELRRRAILEENQHAETIS